MLPRLRRATQQIDRPLEIPPVDAVRREFAKLGLDQTIRPGQSVALTAGSRGIAQIADILRATVDQIRLLGGVPFIVPAMGSHGGGTAEGQIEVLSSYGIKEENIGAPIHASMEVIEIGRHPMGGPIYLDKVGISSFASRNYNPHSQDTAPAGPTGDYRMTITLQNQSRASGSPQGESRSSSFVDLIFANWLASHQGEA